MKKKEDTQAEAQGEAVDEIQSENSKIKAAAQTETFEGDQAAESEGQAAPNEDPFNVTAPAGRPAVVRAPKGLNLREGPALSYEVLEVLPDGVEVTAPDLPMGAEVPGWRLVYTGERAGWVQSRFLRLEG